MVGQTTFSANPWRRGPRALKSELLMQIQQQLNAIVIKQLICAH